MTYITLALKKNADFDSGCTHELNPGGEFLTLTSQAAPDSGPRITLLYSLSWNPELLHLLRVVQGDQGLFHALVSTSVCLCLELSFFLFCEDHCLMNPSLSFRD